MSLAEPTPHPAPTTPPSATKWSALDFALLAGVLLLAFALRVTSFDSDLSFDELWHLGTTPGHGSPLERVPSDVLLPGLQSMTSLEGAAPIWSVWTHMDGVLHPPLFCVTMRIWRELIGQGDAAAHYYSVFWSMIAIGFLFATARLALDRWAALIVGVGTAISQVQIYFAQEVRSYQLLVAIASVAVWVMTRIEILGPTRRRAIGLALLTLPLLLTHYFAAGAALAIGVYGLIRLRGHRIAFIVTGAACGLFYLAAWVPFALRQIDDLYTGDSFLHVEHFDYVRELLLVCCAPWRLLIDKDYTIDPMTLVAGLLFVIPWFLVKKRNAMLPWTIWLAGSILAIVALDLWRSSRHMEFTRYYGVASPAVLLLAVGTVYALDRKVSYVVGAGLLALLALGGRVDERISVDSPYHADARNYVRDQIKPGEALLIYRGTAPEDYNQMMALTFSHAPAFHDRPTIKMTRPLTAEMVARLPDRAWLAAFPFQTPLSELIPGARLIRTHEVKDQALLMYVQVRGEEPATAPGGEP